MNFMEDNKRSTVVSDTTESGTSVGESGARKNKYQNAIAKVLCVLAAIALWFYVVSTNTAIEERVFPGIPVTFRNTEVIEEELGMSVISGYDYTVDVTINGTKADLDAMSAEDIAAYVDVSGVDEPGEHILEISTAVPNGMTVVKKSTSLISVYIDKNISINVPVKVETLHSTPYSLGTPEPYDGDKYIRLTGPAAVLEGIDHALVTLDLGPIDRSITATGRPVLIDKQGARADTTYVTLNKNEISVRIPIYDEKDVPLKAAYKYGYYNSSNVAVVINPETIRIKGDPVVLSGIESADVLIDEKSVMSSGTIEAPIVDIDGAENISSIKVASVRILHKNTETISLTVNVQRPENTGEYNYIMGVSSAEVTFRGRRSDLLRLNRDNVSAELNTKDISISNGLNSIPLIINIPEALEGLVYEIGTYELEVMVETNAK